MMDDMRQPFKLNSTLSDYTNHPFQDRHSGKDCLPLPGTSLEAELYRLLLPALHKLIGKVHV